ncbi:MAG TPA: hypothetical protein VHM28_06110 [Anaerolineales bacterium]|jgi:hypothetical protein|nr:hypothetical protein [Anaerolineales bacterium]
MRIKYLQRLFIILIIITSLYASIATLISTKDLGSTSDDPVADWETRFQPLKEQLPFQRGVVGYISDSNIPGADFDAANEEGEYVLVQYVMSPIIIIKGTDQEWNVANLSPQTYKIWSASNNGQFEVIPFKGNIYLLHKAGP